VDASQKRQWRSEWTARFDSLRAGMDSAQGKN
jgi:hypothetical protein